MAMTDIYPFDWTMVCSEPTGFDAPLNSGVISPNLISRTGITIIDLPTKMNYIDIRLRYPYDATITTDVIIEPFGQPQGSSGWNRVLDTGGNSALELTSATGTDVEDGTWKYTASVNPWYVGTVSTVLVAVQSGLVIDDDTGAQLEIRPKLYY